MECFWFADNRSNIRSDFSWKNEIRFLSYCTNNFVQDFAVAGVGTQGRWQVKNQQFTKFSKCKQKHSFVGQNESLALLVEII